MTRDAQQDELYVRQFVETMPDDGTTYETASDVYASYARAGGTVPFVQFARVLQMMALECKLPSFVTYRPNLRSIHIAKTADDINDPVNAEFRARVKDIVSLVGLFNASKLLGVSYPNIKRLRDQGVCSSFLRIMLRVADEAYAKALHMQARRSDASKIKTPSPQNTDPQSTEPQADLQELITQVIDRISSLESSVRIIQDDVQAVFSHLCQPTEGTDHADAGTQTR